MDLNKKSLTKQMTIKTLEYYPQVFKISINENAVTQEFIVMFVGNNFLSRTVSIGICQGVVFSHDKIHCLDPSKQPRALANL
mgnify:CR=1 FL=1